jgi:hypothetical protein
MVLSIWLQTRSALERLTSGVPAFYSSLGHFAARGMRENGRANRSVEPPHHPPPLIPNLLPHIESHMSVKMTHNERYVRFVCVILG